MKEKDKDKLRFDCRHFIGDRPCRFRKVCTCEHYDPVGKRVLIIKLGALGDVVRTASLLPTLKKKYSDCHITWVSRANGIRILQGHPMVDRFIEFNAESVFPLFYQKFDLVLSLDKEHQPASLCNAVNSPDKRGVMLSEYGCVTYANPEAEYYFRLGVDDDLKFHKNQKSYPQLIHEAMALEYDHTPYDLYCTESELKKARAMLMDARASGMPVVAFNVGSSRTFAHKAPSREKWVDIARRMINIGWQVVLLGGPDEQTDKEWIADQLGGRAFRTRSDSSEHEFVAMISCCDLLITGDTLAMHVAVARRIPLVVLFGPTCPQEIELFGLGEKVVSTHPCCPCYKRSCHLKPTCMDVIDSDQIIETAVHVMDKCGRKSDRLR